jgi:hypothetical protein
MLTSKYLEHKVKQQLKLNGSLYIIKSIELDDYNEQYLPDVPEEIELKCIYHESNGYQKENVGDAAIVSEKPSPMLLCLWQDAEKVKPGDYTEFGNKKFQVIDKNDIQNFGVVCDISLKEVDSFG